MADVKGIPPKPIFTVGIPSLHTSNEIQSIQKGLMVKLEGYHIICYSTEKSEIDFQAFYPQDFDSIEIDELKKIIGITVSEHQ